MNKISKKIVALVTMAAFVLTLAPVAAFADPSSVDPEASTVQTVKKNVEVYTGDKAAFKTNLNVEGNQEVYFWVEDEAGNVVNNVSYYASESSATAATDSYVYLGSSKVFKTTKQTNTAVRALSINKTGSYTIKAGVIKDKNVATNGLTSIDQLAPLQSVDNYSTITVKAADSEVTAINFDAPITGDAISIAPNSFDATTVSATVTGAYTDKEGTASMDGKVISIDNGSNANKGLYVFETGTEKATDEVTVEGGQISFDVKAMNGAVPGVYTIELSADDCVKDLKVTVNGDSEVTSIEVVDTDSVYVDKDAPSFTGVAEVIFKDADGNAAAVDSGDYQLQFVTAPEGFDKTANASKLSLVPVANTDKYALAYGDDLKAGEYTVRLGIVGQTASSAVVELSFTAVKAGDTVALEIDMDNDAETIVSGDYVTGTVYAVDANGIKTAADDADVVLGFANSAAVDLAQNVDNYTDVTLSGTDAMAGKFRVKAKSDEKYYGSKITLIAFDENAKVQATKELTVVDGMSTNTLAFDKEAGSVAKNNTVKVSVVDENGKAVSVGGTAYAYVESQSNEDAKIDVSFADNQVKNGTINMTVYSDKETTADIVVAVKDSTSKAIYANTLSYTFGEQDIPVDTTVVMTIGSSDFVVNNEVVSVEDAAPYIADNRTFVPFRALGEALGADVEWDNDARTVTYTLGKSEVVMTIGETTYTVNGEEKTMDVAPVITGDRTYVPVRFVGEALGFKVIALSAADGTTSSVVFQK